MHRHSERERLAAVDGQARERVLEVRVDEDGARTGREDAPHLTQRRERLGVVMKGVAADDAVERSGAKRERSRERLRRGELPRQHLSLRIGADRDHAAPAQQTDRPSGPAAEIKDAFAGQRGQALESEVLLLTKQPREQRSALVESCPAGKELAVRIQGSSLVADRARPRREAEPESRDSA